MESIKIAPDLSEFSRVVNTIRVKFNGMDINYHMADNYQPTDVCYKWLQAGIAMSSKTHQLRQFMEASPVKGVLEVQTIKQM